MNKLVRLCALPERASADGLSLGLAPGRPSDFQNELSLQ